MKNKLSSRRSASLVGDSNLPDLYCNRSYGEKNIIITEEPFTWLMSMLLPNSCLALILYSWTAEYSIKGPAVPIEFSCNWVEWSIRGLIVPACGIGMTKVAVSDAGVE